MTVEEIRSWPVDENGWHVSPAGLHVRMGAGVGLAPTAILGDYARIGNDASIGDSARIGDYASIGDSARIGDYARIGDSARIGDYASIGDYARIGNDASIGDSARIGSKTTTTELNETFRKHYADLAPVHIFSKWVTRERMSPGWGAGTPLAYPVGAVVDQPDAIVSDQRCGVGLHVFRRGQRPEWSGLCDSGHDYIEILVEVASEDICFAGLPGNDAKLRVKRLKVLT